MTGEIVLYWGIMYGIVSAGLYIIQRFDGVGWEIGNKTRFVILCCSAMNSVMIYEINNLVQNEKILLSVIAGCLIFACVTDSMKCVVFQFTWWISGMAVAVWFFLSPVEGYSGPWLVDKHPGQSVLSLMFYIIVQEIFFGRMYGRADCHAFVICAIVEYICGMDMWEYLCHMLVAFGGLAIVQTFQGNINCKGNLKRPVAFLPYITFSFWMVLYCYDVCL